MNFNYVVADPTGNITVLITSPYTPESRQDMIHEAFIREPSCEQAGFVMASDIADIRLEMMGYEFCGNATLSAAAWHAYSSHESGKTSDHRHPEDGGSSGKAYPYPSAAAAESVVAVESSGVCQPVEVNLTRLGEASYIGTLSMPVPAIRSYRGYPLVEFDGISHMIVPASDYNDEKASEAIKGYAADLGVSALGMMLCSDQAFIRHPAAVSCRVCMRPLVYVPGSDTLIWESGCATGSTAAGWYMYRSEGASHTEIEQPGGTICVDVTDGQLYMTGKVILRPGS